MLTSFFQNLLLHLSLTKHQQPNTTSSYGSGHGGGCCCNKDTDLTPLLFAIGAAALFLQMVITMALSRRRRRRRRRDTVGVSLSGSMDYDVEEDGEDANERSNPLSRVFDLAWSGMSVGETAPILSRKPSRQGVKGLACRSS